MTNTDNDSKSGCGCIVLLLFVIGSSISSIKECVSPSSKTQSFPQTSVSYSYDSIDYINEEEDVSEGDTPYKEFYGPNYRCTRSQCSGIEVTAPHTSDIVVIIKRNNQDGKVISHAYICAGKTYTFDLPNGTFQPFFYYGEDWNPNKETPSGVKGGFVKYESFSKDEPQYINDCIIQYVLQLQQNGNFQTEHSNAKEFF